MQPLLSIATLLFSLKCTSANNEIRVVFNNGFAPSQASGCSASELAKVDAVFTTSRRHLRRDSDTSNSMTSETSLSSSEEARELLYLRACKNICENYHPGTCRAKTCVGFRTLSSAVNNHEGNRNLLTCTEEINEVHTKLDNIRNSVSPSCKNFLEKGKRRAECYANFEYGQIDGIRVWTVSSSGQIIFNSFVAPGGTATICKSMKMNIESMNEPCVDDVNFRLTGPNNYLRDHDEWNAPYTLFGDDGTKFNGAFLSNTGTYNLALTPDYDPTKKKEFKVVVVNNC